MPRLTVTTRNGETRTIEARIDLTVMENIRENGFDELLALCGGCSSCATCHVWVEEEYLDRLPAVGPDEDALLDSSDARRPNSRLSCQLRFTEGLDGLAVRIADED